MVFQSKAQQTIGIPEKQTDGTYLFGDSVTIDADLTVDTNTLHVDSTNNRVGVGTDSPDRGKLQVHHYNSVSGGVFNSPHIALSFNAAPTDNDAFGGITYPTSDSDNYGWSVGAKRTSAGVGDFVFTQHTNSATGSERLRILSSGGITFNGDTAAANALNDYEQGNWTATLTGTSSITNTQGFYTKIGRVVYFNYYSDAITSSSAVSANVGGLPFNCISGTNAYTAVYTAHNTWCPTATGGYVNEGGSTIALTAPGSINTAQTASSGTTYIMIAGWYLTSS